VVTLPPPERLSIVRRFDRTADEVLELLRGDRVADRLFYSASEAGNFSLLWHVAAWAPYVWRRSPSELRRAAGTSVALVVESVVVNGAVKSLFDRARPNQLDVRPHRLRQPSTSSFPSGHASAAAVAVQLLGRDRPRWTRAGLVAAGVVVSTSRAYVRIHHASDVVGGLALGWVLGRALRRAAA
jgi:undecaprenyl-diphosphatase